MKYLVTGAAGFIGFHVAQRLCEQGHQVIGIDNINDYYDINLKQARLATLNKAHQATGAFSFIKLDIADRHAVAELFKKEKFNRVIHLAAQAGVRYSIDNPLAYADANLIGHLTILEGCRHNNVEHLVYASSSSVYGLNNKVPFATSGSVDHPVSLYAATKKSNELMSQTYSHLYDLPTTGLRFFTVYGPWGRPDMALFKFTERLSKVRVSTFIITVICDETLLISTILLKVYYAFKISFHSAIHSGQWKLAVPMKALLSIRCLILAMVSQLIYSILFSHLKAR